MAGRSESDQRRDVRGRLVENPGVFPFSRVWLFPGSRRLMPFPRHSSTVESASVLRQERQIVQSRLNLRGFLP